MGRLGRLLLIVALLATAGAMRSWGQADTGRIAGVVKDTSGAVIPGATVIATHTETGETTTAKTDGAGGYTFPSLIAGTYNITVSMTGFATTSNQGYVLTDASSITASFELKPSGHTEEITIVTTSVDQVNTQTGEVSHVIDGDTVRDLALNGRNYLDLLGTLPGSVQAGLGDAISETTNGTTTNINLNGARATSNGLYIDGFMNKDIGSNASQFNNVGIDFIDHVRVQTSSFSSQYGQAAGPTINVVTRAGTNKIHGTMFEFIRNSAVDATNYFSYNAITLAPIRAHLRYNDFGGALGGPIVIPHLIDGHDKLFFFIGTEWKLIAQQSQPAIQTLPLQSQINGIFPGTNGCAFSSFPIYVNGVPKTESTPTNCNISQYVTAFGQAYQKEINYVIGQATTYLGTACNVAAGDCTNNGNTIFELAHPFRNHQYVARVDYTISRRQSIYGRWFADTHTTTNPIGDGATPVTPYHDEAPANNVLISHSFVVSPGAVNEVSFGALFSSINFQPYGSSWLRSSYGYSYQPYYVNSYKVGIPSINLFGFSALDSDAFMTRYHPSYFQLQDIYTLVIARQTLKFGALIGRNRADTNGKANYMGGAAFEPTISSTNSTGNAVADALLGNFSTYSESPTDTFGQFRLTSYAAYVDDIWRAASKLSLNFGVRFEHLTPWTAVQDNLSDFYPNFYDPTQAVHVNTLGVLTPGVGNANNGLRRAGSGVPSGQDFRVPTATLASTLAVPTSGSRGFYKGQYVFMPRMGFAYDLNGNGQTSFRGGVGLFYDTPQANSNFSTLILPPYSPNVNIENGNMDNVASYANQQYPFAAMYTLDPNFQRTYVYQYNFGIQQQFPANFFFQINYVGAEGRHLLRHPDINGVDPTVEDCVAAAFDAAGAVVPVLDWMRQYTSATLPATANGFTKTGQSVNVPVKGSTACNALPPASSNGYGGYAGYDAIYQWRSDVDYNYNGLQANLNRRVGKGRLTLTYTLAKTLSTGSADGDVDHIELYSKKYNYGPTSFDRRNVITSTYIVQAGPLSGHNLVMREALASWMLTGTVRYQGGTYNTVSGTDELGVSSRANYCGHPIVYGHTAANWFYTTTPQSSPVAGAGLQNFTAPTIYAPSHFASTNAAPCQGNYTVGVGDAPVGNVIGPRLINFDVSARKTFELSARYRLTVNFDGFNVFNHPNFSVPFLNVNSQITPLTSAQAPITGQYEGIGSAGRPRNISAGARLYF